MAHISWDLEFGISFTSSPEEQGTDERAQDLDQERLHRNTFYCCI